MVYYNLLSAFQSNLFYMSEAQNRVQSGFQRIYEKDSMNIDESRDFISAFVEEDFAARLAEANLKMLKSHDEMTKTLIDIKS